MKLELKRLVFSISNVLFSPGFINLWNLIYVVLGTERNN
jgi:hypothetical protein